MTQWIYQYALPPKEIFNEFVSLLEAIKQN